MWHGDQRRWVVIAEWLLKSARSIEDKQQSHARGKFRRQRVNPGGDKHRISVPGLVRGRHDLQKHVKRSLRVHRCTSSTRNAFLLVGAVDSWSAVTDDFNQRAAGLMQPFDAGAETKWTGSSSANRYF